MPARIVTDGLEFPEGPMLLPDGSLAVTEIAGRRLTRIDKDSGKKTTIAKINGGPNGQAIGPDGAIYVCNNGGTNLIHDGSRYKALGPASDYDGGKIERVDLATGESRVLYRGYGERRLSSPNDIVFDRQGGFYFTDYGKSHPAHRIHGAVYYATPDGSSIREVVFPFWGPNGIALSPDGSTLYVAETETARLWAFTIKAPGELEKLPHPSPHGGRLIYGLPGYQRFDSLAVQANGDICVATQITGGISVFSPDGKLVRWVPTEDYHTTNICFGGPDMKTAYITLSDFNQLIEMPWPDAGLALNF